MKKVAVVGTQGVPAKYGGFETLVENIIGDNCSADIQYTIFCSSKDFRVRHDSYKNCRLLYVPLHANGVQSILYDIWSLCRTMRGYDTILVLGTSGCCFLPFFRLFCHTRLIVNIDGLEHRRGKWGKWAKWFLRESEIVAMKYADVVIADNKGIQEYVRETYHKTPVLIAYGGDHVEREVAAGKQMEILQQYGVSSGGYCISVCRIEPENNCHVILEAFAKTGKKLVYIGNWERNDYGKALKEKYSNYANIIIHEPEYDLDTLYALRSHAAAYVHGHSAGGTNPSLVEAMFFGKPIVAFDCVYNRTTTYEKAYYFKDCDSLLELINHTDLNGREMRVIASEKYTWKKIASQYESLY